VNGLRMSLITNYTGSLKIGAMFRNERASPGLSYLDTNSHGYAVATLTEEEAKVELVNVGDVSKDTGPEGAPVLRRARFRVKAWKGGAEPVLEGPEFEGEPAFPFA